MSRSYEVTILVEEHDREKIEAIGDAVRDLEYEADPNQIGSQLIFDSETINVAAGHTDEDIATEIAHAIWAANGAWCRVRIGMRDLDANVPEYSLDQAAHDDWALKIKRPELFIP